MPNSYKKYANRYDQFCDRLRELVVHYIKNPDEFVQPTIYLRQEKKKVSICLGEYIEHSDALDNEDIDNIYPVGHLLKWQKIRDKHNNRFIDCRFVPDEAEIDFAALIMGLTGPF